MSSSDFDKLVKHVPRILGRQLLGDVSYKFIARKIDLAFSPSVERFYAALLFVDISGFTVLSQKLNVDDLKTHINAYFKKMLDIVNFYDGDVVKFAGDALFIIWQIKGIRSLFVRVNVKGDTTFAEKSAVIDAVRCGSEINRFCSNYKIIIRDMKVSESELSSALSALDGKDVRSIRQSISAADVAFLNVHSGVSMGLMAGIDVGSNERCEYLLLSSALSDVAVAEGDAHSGDVVITAQVHAALHGAADSTAPGSVLPCGCTVTPNGCFKVDFGGLQMRTSEGMVAAADQEPRPRSVDAVEDLSLMFRAVVREHVWAHHEPELRQWSKDRQLHETPQRRHVFERAVDNCMYWEELQLIQNAFLSGGFQALTNGIGKHVHEADREGFVANAPHDADHPSLKGLMKQEFDQAYLRTEAADLMRVLPHGHPEHQNGGALQGTTRKLVSSVRASVTRRASLTAKYHHILAADYNLTAEIRTVVVMFIKINLRNSQLLLSDPSVPQTEYRTAASRLFHFLPRSAEEMAADQRILEEFQQCIETILAALTAAGGQLRQFIVDDKGTVAIASFGQRGAVNDDDAAAAVEASQEIVTNLGKLGMSAGIGITSGRVYCGLVGSEERHEYAIMGPSANLSARLMGKAAPMEVLCDDSTRQRDRVHVFESLGEISAKGYAKPVAIYKPKTTDVTAPLPLIGVTNSPKITPNKRPPGLKLQRLNSLSNTSPEKLTVTQQKALLDVRKELEQIRLFGRSSECSLILNSLLPFAPAVDTATREKLLLALSGEEPADLGAALQLDPDQPSVHVYLSGEHGIGKTAIVTQLAKRLQGTCKVSLKYFYVTRTVVGAFHADEPFYAWKVTIRQLIWQLRPEETSALVDMREAINAAVDALFDRLPIEFARLQPLLGSIDVISAVADNEVTAKITGKARLEKTGKLLEAILHLFVQTTRKRLIVVMDDAHAMDAFSASLLKDLVTEPDSAGISVLSTTVPTSRSPAHHHGRAPLEVFTSLSSERNVKIDISPLDKPSIVALARKMYEAENMREINRSVLDQLFELSGGNPLYATELAAVFRDKQASGGAEGELVEEFQEFRPQRIEEVISIRFDRLSPISQHVVKLAAVVCKHSEFCTVALIDAVLTKCSDGAAHDTTEDVYRGIRELLAHNEFLRSHSAASFDMRKSYNTNNYAEIAQSVLENSAQTQSDEDICQLRLDFKISLEKDAIYDLMLEEQRQSLHFHVASLLEFDFAQQKRPDSTELFQIASHFESGGEWSNAMSLFYRSAMSLDSKGAYIESRSHLTAAYRMLDHMYRDAGIVEGDGGSLWSDYSSKLSGLNNGTTPTAAATSTAATGGGKLREAMDNSDVCRIFDGDGDALETAMRVLVKLGQITFTLRSEILITAKLFDNAFKLMSLTWRPVGDSADGSSGGCIYMKDLRMCFPVLSGISLQYRERLLPDDENHSKELEVCQLFVTLAKSSPEYEAHLVVAYFVMRSGYASAGLLNQAKEYMHLAMALYDHKKHSAEIAQTYGTDRMLGMVASTAAVYAMQAEAEASLACLRYITERLPIVEHFPTYALGVLGSTCLLSHCFHLHDEALALFRDYLDRERTTGAFSLFKPQNQLVLVWMKLRQRVAQGLPLCCGANAEETDADVAMLQDIEEGKYLFPREKRPFSFTIQALVVLSVEVLSAECLLMQYHASAQLPLDRKTAMLVQAEAYVRHSLSFTEPEKAGYFPIYAHTMGLLLLVSIVKEQYRISGDALRKSEAIAQLNRCDLIATKFDFKYVAGEIAKERSDLEDRRISSYRFEN